jgi:hypothetical protein
MNISRELKSIKVQFDEVRKQLNADYKKKRITVDHHCINHVKISKELSKLLRIMPNSNVSRATVYHKFYLYLIRKNLLLGDNTFKLTEQLETVLDLSCQETLESLSKKLKCDEDSISHLVTKNIHLANTISMLEHNFIE